QAVWRSRLPRRHARASRGTGADRAKRRIAPARPRRRPRRAARAGGADLPVPLRTRPGGGAYSLRLTDQQPVPLSPEAEFHWFPGWHEDKSRIVHRHIIEPHRALGDLALGFLVRRREAERGQRVGDVDPVADRKRGQVLARAALTER